MRGWRNFGVAVAVVVAIAVSATVAMAPREASEAAQLGTPTEVTLVLETDGVSLRVAHGALDVSFEF
ncbi:MAG: hypothetical protein R3C30_16040 [Hyphomonadaceae bacterium]